MKGQTLYVIYVESKHRRGSQTNLDSDGKPTTLRIEAITFYTDFDARKFAHEMSINVTGVGPYVGAEQFLANEEPLIWTHA